VGRAGQIKPRLDRLGHAGLADAAGDGAAADVRGAVARGDAELYLRLPTRKDYREKVWDHAAGALVVTEAGGVVTDVDGRALDFSHGRSLESNRGVIASVGGDHDLVLAAVKRALG
jgi:3'(2'), 5'-bisphosphate nucleotidase